jgi:P4 family phage/plasmid primase-like protien
MSTETKDVNAKPDLQAVRVTAHKLLALGLVPVPLPDGQKRPQLKDWQTLPAEKLVTHFVDGCNIGLRLDTLTDIDLDCHEAIALGAHFLKTTRSCWGRATSRHSHHLYAVANSRYEKFVDPMETDPKKSTILEIRHDSGHQSMIPPSVHPDTGETLQWEAGENFKPEEWNFHEMRRAVSRMAAAVLLIRHIQHRHDTWLYLSGAMKKAGWNIGEATFLMDIVSRFRDETARIEEFRKSIVDSFNSTEPVAGLKKLEDYLPKPVVRKIAQWLDLRQIQADPLDLTDDSNATAIHTEHGEDLRFLVNEGRGGLWVHWNDVVWQRDLSGYVNHIAAATLKKKADKLTAESRNGAFIEKVRKALLNVPGVTGALKNLSWYPDLVVPPDKLDSDPYLVGLQNGIYNLKLDRLEEGTRENLISRQMAASFEPGASCPRWLVCLKRAQPDAEVRAFLQRLAGACLIGEHTEHGLTFNYGSGANFKTMYAEIIRIMMGDYAGTPNEDLFFEGNHEVPRNYIADIHGKRLLTTSEKKEGSKWNVDFIKRLLGGEQLNACRKYCEAFDFQPTCRVVVSANNRPHLNDVDEAIRRRFYLVPWNVTIPETGDVLLALERDEATILRHLESGARIPRTELVDLLLEERNGILNWMLAGTRDFIKRGLRLEPPAVISYATNEYLLDEDLMGRFVKDWCQRVEIATVLSDIELRQMFQAHGTDAEKLCEAFSAWSGFGRKHSWGRQKVSRKLAKVEGIRSVRVTGNRTVFNLSLTDEALAAVKKSHYEPGTFEERDF